jgi:hypothetical protein
MVYLKGIAVGGERILVASAVSAMGLHAIQHTLPGKNKENQLPEL